MPVDLSEIEAFSKGTGGPPCGTRTVLAGEPWKGGSLSKKDREMLKEALAQPDRFSSRTLAMWLRSKGIELGESAIGRHRSGGCRCERP